MGTLNKIKVKQAQAADPGIAFALAAFDENSNPVAFNCGLYIRIQIATVWSGGTYTYETDVTVWNPISDQVIVFAVPFGDLNFDRETSRTYTITISATAQGQNGSTSPFTPFNNVDDASNSLPTVAGSFTLNNGSITF